MNASPSKQIAESNTPSKAAEDEIDLREIAAFISRHCRFIAAIATVSLVLSGFYAYTRKPVWQAGSDRARSAKLKHEQACSISSPRPHA